MIRRTQVRLPCHNSAARKNDLKVLVVALAVVRQCRADNFRTTQIECAE
jgi:hypothetical protein